MIIYRPDNEPFMDIQVDDESYHFAEIMGRDDVTLYFSLPHFVDFPVGCYVKYPEPDDPESSAPIYTLYSVDKMRMEHRRDYEYTITFESEAAELENYILTLFQSYDMWGWRGTNEGDFKFPYAASSQEHLQIIATCMTRKTGQTWTVGHYVDGGDKLIAYDTMTCLDALKQIANTFETEYSVVGHQINLGKVEFFTNPQEQITISYGKGNGLRPGVEKLIDTSEKAIGKVYVQGGDRNIDPSKYGSTTLHLPPSTYFDPTTSQTIDRYWWYDGHTVSDTQFEGARQFSCPTGKYIALVENNAPIAEGALDLSEIYPCYDHYIERAVEVSAENNLWDIYSSSFTSGTSTINKINYGECLIANDEQLSIIFQDGRLAGRQFGVNWTTKEDPENEGETIAYMEIVPSQQDGLDMPSSTNGFYPAAGDTIRVFNCYLPETYIRAAEMEMLEQALAYLWERMSPRFSIKGEVDPIWSSSRWLNIGGHFKPGAYFRFVDPTWENEGVSIRISNVKTFINKPHQPIVEMMSGLSRPGVSTAIQKIQAEAKIIPESYGYSGRSFTKRSFADAKETMEMLIKAGLEGFDAAISPIAVQTMQLIAESEQLQFMFFTDRTCVTPVTDLFSFDSSTKQFTVIGCALKHMTLDIKDIRPDRENDDYLRWNMAAYESAALTETDKAYYVYAKCDALNNGTNHLGGEFILSETAIGMEDQVYRTDGVITGGYYHFLCGILNAERGDNRSFAPMYGFSEVLPGQITTDTIRGTSGQSWWDLVTNQINIGNKLTYSPANGLRLQGALVVNGGGNSSVMGVWRGEYLPGNSYYEGDEVWWEDTSTHLISTYRCKTFTPSGNYPSDTRYWEVVAQGEAGNGIDAMEDSYWSVPVTDGQHVPTSGGTWGDTKPQPVAGMFIWKRTRTTFTNSSDIFYSYTAEYCAQDGTSGDDGPMLVGRGNYDKDDQGNTVYDGNGNIVHQIYYGTAERRDVVYYNGRWYMANNVGRSFSNHTPPTSSPYSDTYWTSFEGNFSNVATGLLFAARAHIDKGYVSELSTTNNNEGYIKALGGTMTMYDTSGVPKLVITGKDLSSIGGSGGSITTTYDYLNAIGGVINGSTDALATFTVTNAANTFTIDDTTLIVTRSSTSYEETMTFSAAFRIDGQDITGINVVRPVGSSETNITGITIPGVSVSLPEGQHTLTMYVRAELPSLSRVRVNAPVASIAYNAQAVEIGANGLRISFSPTIYAAFLKDTDDGNNYFVFRNGNYGFRISSVAGTQRSNNMNVTNPTWTTLQ